MLLKKAQVLNQLIQNAKIVQIQSWIHEYRFRIKSGMTKKGHPEGFEGSTL